jgi:F0F1-type ATP synthase delta subunit
MQKADDALKQGTAQAAQTLAELEREVKRWQDELAFAEQVQASIH